MTTAQDKNRISELDGVRGVAILMVLVWHYLQNQIVPGTSAALDGLKHALLFSWSGVDLFFVLSGFLIGGILLDNRDATNYFKTFYLRRAFRIFPLYYASLFLFVLLVWLGIRANPSIGWVFDPGDIPLWSYATYTQNILMAVHNQAGAPWLDVTWSLAVEEQFYLVLPFLVRFVSPRQLPLVLCWLIVAAPMLRASLPGLSAYINAPWRADCLFLGVLLACVLRMPGWRELLVRYRPLIYALFAGLLTAVIAMTASAGLTLGGTWTHLLLALFYTCLILLVLLHPDSLLARCLRWRLLVWLGSISYGIYLLHQSVSGVMHGLLRHAWPGMPDAQGVMVTLAALAMTLGLAWFSFRYFERPLIRYGHTFRYAERSPAFLTANLPAPQCPPNDPR